MPKGLREPRSGRPDRSGGTSQNLFVHEENDMTFRPLKYRILVRRIEGKSWHCDGAACRVQEGLA